MKALYEYDFRFKIMLENTITQRPMEELCSQYLWEN